MTAPSENIEAQRVTISFEQSLKEYGTGPSASIHYQVPVAPDSTPEATSVAIREGFALIKGLIAEQLNIKTVTTSVADPVSRPAPKAASTSTDRPSTQRVEEGWRDVVGNREGWFDNRVDKKNPKGPDFKSKNTNKAMGGGFALWLDSAPEWATAALSLDNAPF